MDVWVQLSSCTDLTVHRLSDTQYLQASAFRPETPMYQYQPPTTYHPPAAPAPVPKRSRIWLTSAWINTTPALALVAWAIDVNQW